MKYLLFAVLVIIIYAEVLPTLSLIFEYIRNWLTYGIAVVQKLIVIQQYEAEQYQENDDGECCDEPQRIGFNFELNNESEEGL